MSLPVPTLTTVRTLMPAESLTEQQLPPPPSSSSSSSKITSRTDVKNNNGDRCKKKSTKKDEEKEEEKTFVCRNVGRRYVCGNGTVFLASASDPCLWLTECPDFDLITTHDFTPYFWTLPRESEYRLNPSTGKFVLPQRRLRDQQQQQKKKKKRQLRNESQSPSSSSLLPPLPFKWNDISLKASQNENWRYVLHVSHGMRLSVTRDVLRARAIGGQILAYQYTECSIEGNEACYYGYLTTRDSVLTDGGDGSGSRLLVTAGVGSVNDGWTWKGVAYTAGDDDDDEDDDNVTTTTTTCTTSTALGNKDERVVLTQIVREHRDDIATRNSSSDDGVHRICRVAAQRVWPRRLNVYLKKDCACSCSPDCVRWTVQLRDLSFKRRVCTRYIPWPDVYIMMGGTDDGCFESIKETRNCPVCAQCFNCSRGPTYCRRHRICKHQGVKTYGGGDGNNNNDDDDDDDETIDQKLARIAKSRCGRKRKAKKGGEEEEEEEEQQQLKKTNVLGIARMKKCSRL